MARSYSQDLRDRVIESKESGTSARKTAARFEVAASAAIKWLERLRDTGERSARRQGRRPGSKLDSHRDFLLAAVQAEPDSDARGTAATPRRGARRARQHQHHLDLPRSPRLDLQEAVRVRCRAEP